MSVVNRPACHPNGRLRYLVAALAGMWQPLYVIDARETSGYLFRAPAFVARSFCRMYAAQARRDTRLVRQWGCAPTPDGY